MYIEAMDRVRENSEMEVTEQVHTCNSCKHCVVTYPEEVSLCYEDSHSTTDYVRGKHIPSLCFDHNRNGKCIKWQAKAKKPFWRFLF